MLVLPLTVSTAHAEKYSSLWTWGGNYSVSLTAIGAVLIIACPPPSWRTIRKNLLMNFMPIPVRYWRNKWHRLSVCYRTCINGQFWSYISENHETC